MSKYVEQNPDFYYHEVKRVGYVFNPKTARLRVLSPTASFIWKQARKPVTAITIASKMTESFEVDEKVALKDTRLWINRWLKAKVLLSRRK